MLRAATADDHPLLEEVFYHAIYVPAGAPPVPRAIVAQPELARYIADFGQRVGDLGLLAFEQDTLQGGAWVRLMQGYGFVAATIPELTIAVLPPYRGQGLGTHLLNSLFQQVQPQFSAISLSVQRTNPAYHLYQRLGFVVHTSNAEDWIMLKTF
jgi:ribosomal protein S18 acetylase RimI-like enzyme